MNKMEKKEKLFSVGILITVVVFYLGIGYGVNLSEIRRKQENREYLELIVNKGFSITEGRVESPSVVYTVSKDEFLELLDTEDLADVVVFVDSHITYWNYLYVFSPDYQIAWMVNIGYWIGELEV